MESTLKQPDQSTDADPAPERRCPGCRRKLSLGQIITMMHGSGYEQYVQVKLADGTIAFVEAGLVNPTLVEVLDQAT
jgi:hypothetical protein